MHGENSNPIPIEPIRVGGRDVPPDSVVLSPFAPPRVNCAKYLAPQTVLVAIREGGVFNKFNMDVTAVAAVSYGSKSARHRLTLLKKMHRNLWRLAGRRSFRRDTCALTPCAVKGSDRSGSP